MAHDGWYPLSVVQAGKMKEYDTLVEGVPRYLHHALDEWIGKNFLTTTQGSARVEALELIELKLKTQLSWRGGSAAAALDNLRRMTFWEGDGEKLLDAIHLALCTVAYDPARLVPLEEALSLGGSAWMVAPSGRGLSRRVDPTAAEAAKVVMSSGSRAAQMLADAWAHVYGRNPNPSEGYHQAVRAAEAAACPVIIPADPSGSLGKAIKALEQAPSGKYLTVFTELETSDPLVAVRGLMELVWKQHIDRHGSANEDVPVSVSQAEAEAALFAAVALVQWFERGVIKLAQK